MQRARWRLSALCAFVLVAAAPVLAQEQAPQAPAQPQTDVAIALVLAVDASGSVDNRRFELQKQGYMRKGHENVVGPMPPFGAIIKNADDLWRILAFVRSQYHGDPAYKYGTPPDQE